MFGGVKPTGSLFDSKNSLFGNQAGGGLFNKKPDEAEEEGNDSDGTGKGGNSPPAFAEEPDSLNLEDTKVEKSPFTKLFEKEV